MTMATVKEVAKNGSTAKPAEKAKKASKSVTIAQLKEKGLHGNALVVIRKAFALATVNEFKNTVVADSKYPKNKLYSTTSPDGSYWELPVDGDEFKAIRSAAKLALPDLRESKYTKNVQALINVFQETQMGNGGGPRGFSAEGLQGISL